MIVDRAHADRGTVYAATGHKHVQNGLSSAQTCKNIGPQGLIPVTHEVSTWAGLKKVRVRSSPSERPASTSAPAAGCRASSSRAAFPQSHPLGSGAPPPPPARARAALIRPPRWRWTRRAKTAAGTRARCGGRRRPSPATVRRYRRSGRSWPIPSSTPASPVFSDSRYRVHSSCALVRYTLR
jgi:hypothetical protein